MSSRNQIAERLQALLAERDLAPGDRLPPERHLAAELGIARSSLREGLRRLVELGIVEARQGSGTYLARLDLGDLVAVRLRLEPYAARLAAQRRTEADLAVLEQALAAMRAQRHDPAAFAAADAQLHAAVTEASGSLPLRVLLIAIADLLRQSRVATASDPTVRAYALSDLEQLVDAVRSGDGAGAERAMRAHLKRIEAVVPLRTSA